MVENESNETSVTIEEAVELMSRAAFAKIESCEERLFRFKAQQKTAIAIERLKQDRAYWKGAARTCTYILEKLRKY